MIVNIIKSILLLMVLFSMMSIAGCAGQNNREYLLKVLVEGDNNNFSLSLSGLEVLKEGIDESSAGPRPTFELDLPLN